MTTKQFKDILDRLSLAFELKEENLHEFDELYGSPTTHIGLDDY